MTPNGESQTPPTSRTGETEEAHQLKLSCSVFWKGNFLSMSLSFPDRKRQTGWCKVHGVPKSSLEVPSPGIFQWAESVPKRCANVTPRCWPVSSDLWDRLTNHGLLSSCLNLRPSPLWLPSLLWLLFLPPHFPPPWVPILLLGHEEPVLDEHCVGELQKHQETVPWQEVAVRG